MNAHTKPQIIRGADNQPLYAVVPYDEYMALTGDDNVTVPHDVAILIAVEGLTPLKAWRLYRGFSQEKMAEKLNTTQSAIAQVEKKGKKNQQSTLEKWAAVFECEVNQLN